MTWLGYMLMATTTFVMGALGPLMPFLRAELHLNMTVAALHFSAWSTGSLVAGFAGDAIVRAIGRHRIIWLSAALVSCCLLTLISAQHAVFTIGCTFCIGFCASVVGISINSLMSDRFGSERAIGITESNLIASLVCCAAPVVVGTAVRCGLSWRTALLLPILSYIALFTAFRRDSAQEFPMQTKARAWGPLPLAYWAYWCVIVLNVGCEWSMALWSAEFLERVCALARADAATGVTAFLSAMVVGRFIGRKLSARYATQTLLPIAAAVAMSGFLIFWLPRCAAINIAGLFITGLGISNFYPLTLSAALTVAADNSTAATARMSIGTGLAVLSAPLALGCAADRFGVFQAYGIIGILLFCCALMVLVANRQARLHAQTEAVAAAQVAT